MFYSEKLDMVKKKEIYKLLLTVNVMILNILFPLLTCLNLQTLAICHVLRADALRSCAIIGRRHSPNPTWLSHWGKMLFLGDLLCLVWRGMAIKV